MRVQIQVGDATIDVEGELSEVSEILGKYWPPSQVGFESNTAVKEDAPSGGDKPKPKARPAHRSKKPKKIISTAASGIDATEVANAIKSHELFAEIKAKILDVSADWLNKCKLVAYVVDGPVGSGDVHRVLTELRIKTALPRMSEAFGKGANEFLTTPGPNGSTLYTMTTVTKDAFENWLKSTDE